MALWSVLEAEPSNQKQQCILDGDIKNYVLCQENMNYLTEVHLEVISLIVLAGGVLSTTLLTSLIKKFHSWNSGRLHYGRR